MRNSNSHGQVHPYIALFCALEELNHRRDVKDSFTRHVENETIVPRVLKLMQKYPKTKFTVSDLCRSIPDLPNDMSRQRMLTIMQQLLSDTGTGEVEKIIEGRQVYFQLTKQAE